jgi:R67 dihydrofolate reductase
LTDTPWPGAEPIGTLMRKIKGNSWRGKVVDYYSSEYNLCAYCIESMAEPGNVQVYPAAALEPWDGVLDEVRDAVAAERARILGLIERESGFHGFYEANATALIAAIESGETAE